MHARNVRLATLLNSRVRNSAGEDLGKIEDVVIDAETGSIRYAILSFNGVGGMGNKLFPVPWSFLSRSPSGDYLLNLDKRKLERAPAFTRDRWADPSDPAWQRDIQNYYGIPAPVVRERTTVYAERRRRGIPVLATIVLICLVGGLIWAGYLISTRGWDQAKQDMMSTVQRAAYAAKETSGDAALTTKVKTALSLSKRIPAGQINVDSDGGIVTLRGEVSAGNVREVAESIARDVPGVQEVRNHIFVPSQ
jgi:sporulation protein YlmC with PRC-barrel domain